MAFLNNFHIAITFIKCIVKFYHKLEEFVSKVCFVSDVSAAVAYLLHEYFVLTSAVSQGRKFP
jgi:hypothetical protein